MFRTISARVRSFSFSAALDLLRFAGRRLDEEQLPQVAGSLTFTVVFAIVPMLTVAFAIFTAFPLFSSFRDALDAYLIQSLLPQGVAETIMGYLNQFAAKSARLSAVGGIALIITAVLMMSTIERVFNQIWRVKSNRPFLQRLLLYWAIITLGPLVLGASFSVTAYLFATADSVVSRLPLLGALFYTLISVLLTTFAFTLLYVAVPNRAVDWRDAAWGGLLAGVALEVAKRGFAIYVTKFPTYTIVYGAIAAVPIFLIWVYLFWMITLCGALVTAALPVVKYERWWHVAKPGSAFVDAMAILKVLFHARVHSDSAVVNANRIRDLTRIGFDESENLLQRMLEAGWVGKVNPDLPSHAEWRRRWKWYRRPNAGLDRWVLLANP
ncbi:MAG TPA: YihY family inner membrane protein, partial [Burkholderiaceae bacterium]|nr:YihY family inner membrane protein [Burkholderiaceae bacterium]